VLHFGKRWAVIRQSLGIEPKEVDGINVEQLTLMPMRLDLPLGALWRWVGENLLGCLMVVELSRRVKQHQIIIETINGEREMLHPFHQKG
jgi:hypothetical protein